MQIGKHPRAASIRRFAQLGKRFRENPYSAVGAATVRRTEAAGLCTMQTCTKDQTL